MSPLVIPAILGVMSAIGVGLLAVATGIFIRLGRLTATISDLRTLAATNRDELAQATEGIDRMHLDLSRLVANSNKGAEIVRSVTRLPTR